VLHADVETGDHVLFVGEVVAAHLDESAGPRLVNFGDQWACAEMVAGTIFER
jgi:flavin reductase (DIM6/NTAB) family NADH-FMN oxidoreductase RutF